MTKEALWAKYCEKNPVFSHPDARIAISGRGLRKMFDQTYDIAHAQGVRNGKALADLKSKSSGNIFSDMFGGGFR